MAAQRRALIVYGGWDGHQPAAVAELFRSILAEDGFAVEVSDTLDAFARDRWPGSTCSCPHWTMGTITAEQADPVLAAVAGRRRAGRGARRPVRRLPRAHRLAVHDRRPVGVAPGQRRRPSTRSRSARRRARSRPALADFPVRSEQYYMHVDPAVRVLATTRFPIADGPHAATGRSTCRSCGRRLYGRGRVFYNSLGHAPDVLAAEPCRTILRRGFRGRHGGASDAVRRSGPTRRVRA